MPRPVAMPLPAPAPLLGRPASPRRLRVIPGGRNRPSMTFVATAALDELRLELLAARQERTTFGARARELLRLAMRHLAAGHLAAAGTALVELDRLTAQEMQRAAAMAVCPDGLEEAGHGSAA